MDLMRPISADLLGAIAGPFFHPIILVYLDWPGGAVRVHSGKGEIVHEGQIWRGVGGFGAVSVPEESAGGVPVEFSMALVCDLPELAAYADAQIRHRQGQVYFGATSAQGNNVLLGAPTMLASGTMDTLVLAAQSADGSTEYQLTIGMTTGPGYRTHAAIHHSHQDQSRAYPADTAGQKLVLAMARADATLWPAP